MNAVTDLKNDYLVADIKLADWGRKEIAIPETETSLPPASRSRARVLPARCT